MHPSMHFQISNWKPLAHTDTQNGTSEDCFAATLHLLELRNYLFCFRLLFFDGFSVIIICKADLCRLLIFQWTKKNAQDAQSKDTSFLFRLLKNSLNYYTMFVNLPLNANPEKTTTTFETFHFSGGHTTQKTWTRHFHAIKQNCSSRSSNTTRWR